MRIPALQSKGSNRLTHFRPSTSYYRPVAFFDLRVITGIPRTPRIVLRFTSFTTLKINMSPKRDNFKGKFHLSTIFRGKLLVFRRGYILWFTAMTPRKLTWQWKIHHEWRCIAYSPGGTWTTYFDLVFECFFPKKVRPWLVLERVYWKSINFRQLFF